MLDSRPGIRNKNTSVCTRQGSALFFFFLYPDASGKLVAALWYKTKSPLCFVTSAKSKYATSQLMLRVEQRQFIRKCSYCRCLYNLWKLGSTLKSCHINYPFLIIIVAAVIVVNSLLMLAWMLKAAVCLQSYD